jgi:hypothetical protein
LVFRYFLHVYAQDIINPKDPTITAPEVTARTVAVAAVAAVAAISD